jgi:transcriptional regulator with XRE-family HTH domain
MDPVVTPGMLMGRIIRCTRRKLKQDQAWLSKQSGINQSTVSRIERGDNDLSWRQIVQLSAACGLDFETFPVLYTEFSKKLTRDGVEIRSRNLYLAPLMRHESLDDYLQQYELELEVEYTTKFFPKGGKT